MIEIQLKMCTYQLSYATQENRIGRRLDASKCVIVSKISAND